MMFDGLAYHFESKAQFGEVLRESLLCQDKYRVDSIQPGQFGRGQIEADGNEWKARLSGGAKILIRNTDRPVSFAFTPAVAGNDREAGYLADVVTGQFEWIDYGSVQRCFTGVLEWQPIVRIIRLRPDNTSAADKLARPYIPHEEVQ